MISLVPPLKELGAGAGSPPTLGRSISKDDNCRGWVKWFVIFAQIRIHILLSQKQQQQKKNGTEPSARLLLVDGPNTVICFISNIYAFVMFLPLDFY